MTLNIQGLRLSNIFRSLVLAKLGLRVHTSTVQENLASLREVVSVATPRLEGGGLKSTSIREGEVPRTRSSGRDVHSGEVFGSLNFRETTGQEGDSGDRSREGTSKSDGGEVANLLGGGLLARFSTGNNHVGLQEHALEDDAVLLEGSGDSGPDALRAGLALLDGVVAVDHNFGLDDGDETSDLGEGGVASEGLRVELNLGLGDGAVLNLVGVAPLAEAGAGLVELGDALDVVVEALGHLFTGSTDLEISETLIGLDTGDDSEGGTVGGEGLTVVHLLSEGLFMEDDTGDVLFDAFSTDEELAVLAAVFLSVGEVDAGEALGDGTDGFVSGEEALAGGGHLGDGFLEFGDVRGVDLVVRSKLGFENFDTLGHSFFILFLSFRFQ